MSRMKKIEDERPRPHRPRVIKLIQPGLQVRMVAGFLGVASLALMTELLTLSARLSHFAAEMPEGGPYLASQLPSLLGSISLHAFLILLPATSVFGILITFRTAGPIHRFKQYLASVARGEQPGPCRIRKGDELQDLCDAINEALAQARREGPAPSERRDAA